MNQLYTRTLAALGFVTLAASLGCSVLLDWDPSGLPCDRSRRCLDGYSCLGTTCVPDGSLPEGEDSTCSQTQQCEDGLVCSPKPHFACRSRCSAYFEPTVNCGSGKYCRPFEDPETGETDGSCVPSECTNNNDCDAGDTCVKVSATASGCVAACIITWNGNVYTDNCSASPTEPEYCQPIGAQDAQKLVCLATSDAAQGEDQQCSPFEQDCQAGLACVGGVCKRHCKPASLGGANQQCSGGDTCTTKTNSTPIYGVCEGN